MPKPRDPADKAKIAIPTGFSDPAGVTATTTAAGSCNASIWEADGTLIANGTINLGKYWGGGPDYLVRRPDDREVHIRFTGNAGVVHLDATSVHR